MLLKNAAWGARTYKQILPYLGVDSDHLISNLFETEDEEIIKEGVGYFKDYWGSHFADESRLFAGVAETLDYFKGKKMLLLSNGTASVINKLLESFSISKYFSGIFSADETDCIKPSACPIDLAFKKGYLKEKSRSMMVGDMVIDVLAGKEAGIKTCAVTYGIGTLSELKKSSPDFLIDDISELKDIVV